MGHLEELEEELYSRDETKIQKRIKKGGLLRRAKSMLLTSWQGKSAEALSVERPSDRAAASFFWLALIFIFIVGGAVFVFFYLSTRGQEASVAIHGEERIEAGKLVTIAVSYRNLSRSALREVQLAVVLPPGSIIRDESNNEIKAPSRLIKDVEDVAPGEEKLVEIRARIFGREGENKIVQSSLLYRPENLRARFSVRAEKSFLISHVPLAASWSIPEVLSRGQEVEFKVNYVSNAGIPFANMYLKVDYPPGFIFTESSPEPKIGDGIWSLETLDPGENGTISIKGTISGEEGEIKSFRAGLGLFDEATKEWNAYSESSSETKIAVMPLFVSATLDKTTDKIINPGNLLSFVVRYRNNTNSTIRNASVRTYLEMGPRPDSSSGFLEFSSLEIDQKGVFNSLDRSVVWAPANVGELRELAPGTEGKFSFSIQTKERPPVRGADDRNLVVRLRSKIDAAGIPPELSGINLLGEDLVEYKVRSRILFSGRSLYRASPIPNSGPLPPKVGEKTTYAISWEIRNFTNDLRDAEVKATLPPNIVWENSISPPDAKINFDPASGEVRWKIGEVKAATGVLTPSLVGAFQISVTPGESDAGSAVTLLNGSEFSAKDLFTDEKRTETIQPLTTELREDSAVGSNDWRVVK